MFLKRLAVGIRVALSVLTVVIVFYVIAANWEDFVRILGQVGFPNYLLLSTCWAILALLSPFIVILSLRGPGRKRLAESYYHTAINRLLARYLPGGIWVYIGKGLDLRRDNHNYCSIRKILVFETVNPVLSAALFVGSALFMIRVLGSKSVVLIPLLLTGIYYIVYLLLNRIVVQGRASSSVAYLPGVVLGSLYWIWAASLFSLYFYFVDETCGPQCPMAGVYWVASWVVGYLVFFVPQGMIVSDSVFAWLWSGQLSTDLLLTIINFRAVILVGDIMAVLSKGIVFYVIGSGVGFRCNRGGL